MNKKNFFLYLGLLILLLLQGCGKEIQSQREDLTDYYSTSHTDKSNQTDSNKKSDNKNDNNQTDSNSRKCQHSNDKQSVYIIDSSIECRPNTDLYHNEVKPTWYDFKYDNDLKGYALEFHSNGLKNAIHILGYDADNRYEWSEMPNYQNKFNISWDGKFGNDFIIFVVIKFQDQNGSMEQKDLVYLPIKDETLLNKAPYDNFNITGEYLPIFLGSSAKDGTWRHYERNIIDDLHTQRPNAKICYDENNITDKTGYVNGFALRGSGKVSNIKLSVE
jgi:hypothetical protein